METKPKDSVEEDVDHHPDEENKDKDGAYTYYIPEGQWPSHFSSLLFSADLLSTLAEVTLLGSLSLVAGLTPHLVKVEGSMELGQVARAMWGLSLLRRVYNSYLEAVYCSFPEYRTQPARDHRLKSAKDLVGREKEQVARIVQHDRLTLVSQFILDVAIFFLIPGFYPAQRDSYPPLYLRITALVLNHYLVSFTMYWMHRALHVNAWLWRNIHSFHHWAKHPLSRTTYQDHWLDNFMNAVVGHFFAQILLPLDFEFFWISRVFRVCESLEKHSGVSCWFNLVHSLQRWLPCAQMPHHHDWHHEGHKGCNYTFTSIGGLWDCLFGTRKTGRHPRLAETRSDRQMAAASPHTTRRRSPLMDNPFFCLSPVMGVACLVLVKLTYQLG